MEALEDDALAHFIHFNGKLVNSNSKPTGVRLAQSRSLDLPYISVQTLQAEKAFIPIDFLGNPQKEAKKVWDTYKQKNEEGHPQQFEYFEKLASEGSCVGTESISPRLRQLLIPRDPTGESYVAITPLPSAGLSKLLNDHREAWYTSVDEDLDAHSKIQLPQMIAARAKQVGGANPQNVCPLAREVRPMVFDNLPYLDDKAKKAFSIFYNGPHLKIPVIWAEQYAAFIKKNIDQLSRSWVERQEQATIWSLIDILESQAAQAASLVEQFRDRLPPGTPDLPPLEVGWLYPTQRDIFWTGLRADWVIRQLKGYQLKSSGKSERIPLGLNENDLQRIRKILRGER